MKRLLYSDLTANAVSKPCLVRIPLMIHYNEPENPHSLWKTLSNADARDDGDDGKAREWSIPNDNTKSAQQPPRLPNPKI